MSSLTKASTACCSSTCLSLQALRIRSVSRFRRGRSYLFLSESRRAQGPDPLNVLNDNLLALVHPRLSVSLLFLVKPLPWLAQQL